MELAIPKLPKSDYILQIAVQDHRKTQRTLIINIIQEIIVPLDQFRNLTLTWGNGMVPSTFKTDRELFIKLYVCKVLGKFKNYIKKQKISER